MSENAPSLGYQIWLVVKALIVFAVVIGGLSWCVQQLLDVMLEGTPLTYWQSLAAFLLVQVLLCPLYAIIASRSGN